MSVVCGKHSQSCPAHTCTFQLGHETDHSWEMPTDREIAEIAQGRQHFRSVDEYLTDNGWSPYGSHWVREKAGPLGTREAREMQMRDDEDAGWIITGLTLERTEAKR